jgi:hypothetical protein
MQGSTVSPRIWFQEESLKLEEPLVRPRGSQDAQFVILTPSEQLTLDIRLISATLHVL